MSLKKLFFKSKLSYRLYLYYNLFFREKCFLKREQYSQHGEDIEILKHFKNHKKGFYLDIGCYHPLKFNNTYLLYKKGWSGVNVDLNQTSIDLFNIMRPNDKNICSAVSNESKITTLHFDDYFSSVNTINKNSYEMSKKRYFKNPKQIKIKTISIIDCIKDVDQIDFLNIDAEGEDFNILKLLDLKKYSINLVAIETHLIDGNKNNDCEKIYNYFKNYNFKILGRFGPTSLFVPV